MLQIPLGEGRLVLVPPPTILLGETQYYQAALDPEDGSRLKLEAVAPDGCEAPSLDGGLPGATFEVTRTRGDRLGVYYDTARWGCVAGDGTVQGGPLPEGLIRLTGRFWRPGVKHAVTLSAEAEGKTGEVTIEVKEPDRLGNSKHWYMGVDEEDQRRNVDSLITVWSGKYGVPPQLVKAHIAKESAYRNGAFNPSYRYEPYTAQMWPAFKSGTFEGSPFWLDAVGQSTNAPDHENVMYYDYPDVAVSVIDMIRTYSDVDCEADEGPGDPCDINDYKDIYGRLRVKRAWNKSQKRWIESGELDFYGYTSIGNEYYDRLEKLKRRSKKDSAFSLAQARDSARVYIWDYIRNEWEDGEAGQTVAQTRLASSYGWGQLLYTTAIEPPPDGISYPEDAEYLPEDLNRADAAMESMLALYNSFASGKLGVDDFKSYDEGEWEQGFEDVLEQVVIRWNQSTPYRKDLFRRISSFLPVE